MKPQNSLAYFNPDVIFQFLGQFGIRCMNNFWNSAQSINFWLWVQYVYKPYREGNNLTTPLHERKGGAVTVLDFSTTQKLQPGAADEFVTVFAYSDYFNQK